MVYTTEFKGSFSLNKVLDKETHDFLNKLNQTRRMVRIVDKKYGIDPPLTSDKILEIITEKRIKMIRTESFLLIK